MYTTTKSIHPVDSETNRPFLLTQGIEPTRLISPAGQVFEEYPLLAGVVVPLKDICFHEDNADPTDPLCANIRLKRLYYRDDRTGELCALDVSLLREAQFTNRMPMYWETLVVQLKLTHLFPGETQAVELEVCGQVERDKGLMQIAPRETTLPSGRVVKLVGYEILGSRVAFTEPSRKKPVVAQAA